MAPEIPHNALILLADGAKAVLLRNIGTQTRLVLREERHFTVKDVMNDGPSGMRPEDQTPRQTDEATFAKQVVKFLSAMHEAGGFAVLVLAADPQTLGQMRHAMHKELAQSIVFTLPKDLTNMKSSDVADLLTRHSAAETPR